MTSFQSAKDARRPQAGPIIGPAAKALAVALMLFPLAPQKAEALTLIAPGLESAAPDLVETVQFRRGFARGGVAVGPRGGAIAGRGYAARGPGGSAWQSGDRWRTGRGRA